MEPTLLIGDYIVADMWRYDDQGPERGDLIVFNPPHLLDTRYIKRVVGLEGDSVEVRAGRLYLNGQRAPDVLQGSRRDTTLMPVSLSRCTELCLD